MPTINWSSSLSSSFASIKSCKFFHHCSIAETYTHEGLEVSIQKPTSSINFKPGGEQDDMQKLKVMGMGWVVQKIAIT
jgi:hypothetical protein